MENETNQAEERPLIVYGHDYCAQATMLARTLNDHDIEHEWRDIKRGDPAWSEELRALARGNLSVPTVIFPDGSVLVEPWPRDVLKKLGVKKSGFLDRLFG